MESNNNLEEENQEMQGMNTNQEMDDYSSSPAIQFEYYIDEQSEEKEKEKELKIQYERHLKCFNFKYNPYPNTFY